MFTVEQVRHPSNPGWARRTGRLAREALHPDDLQLFRLPVELGDMSNHFPAPTPVSVAPWMGRDHSVPGGCSEVVAVSLVVERGATGCDRYAVPMSVVVRVLGPLEVICDGRPVVILGPQGTRAAGHAGVGVVSCRAVRPAHRCVVGRRAACCRSRCRCGCWFPVFARRWPARVPTTRSRRPHLGTCIDCRDVDVAQFVTLSARGRKELADGRFVGASATLAQSLALWRSERLAEAGTRYLQGESDRFAEVRLTVLEARIAADLACGRHAECSTELAALCGGHPLREGLWAQWIMALYRCGRQADACRRTRISGRRWARSWG